jgi:hypothetical protein
VGLPHHVNLDERFSPEDFPLPRERQLKGLKFQALTVIRAALEK